MCSPRQALLADLQLQTRAIAALHLLVLEVAWFEAHTSSDLHRVLRCDARVLNPTCAQRSSQANSLLVWMIVAERAAGISSADEQHQSEKALNKIGNSQVWEV